MNSKTTSFVIHNDANYHHFMVEVVLGLHRELDKARLLQSRECILYYSGPFKSFLDFYSRDIRPRHEALEGTPYARSVGAICQDLKKVSDHLVKEIPSDKCNTITLLKRTKNRRLINYEDIKCALQEINLPLIEAQPEHMSAFEQLKLYRKTRLLVGAHSAGFTNMMFMQPGTLSLELNPYGFFWKGYHHMASIFEVNLSEMEGLPPKGYGTRYPKSFAPRYEDGPWTRDEYLQLTRRKPQKFVV
jgi:hypothetical protein